MSWFSRINTLALALCFVVIVFGAFVRLSDAGLGCPDWPGCYGHLVVPEAAHAVAAAEQKYPSRPVEAPKAWKEMIHRYLASTLGLLIVSMALLSAFMRRRNLPRVLPWVLVALVVFQGMLGMWTVTWQLKPLVVTGHLLGGMTTLSLLLWMRLSLRARKAALAGTTASPSREPRNERQAWVAIKNTGSALTAAAMQPRGLRALAALGLIVLACQIFLGGWTSSNYAALACPDFPTCHGSYWPQTDVREAFTLWRGLDINYEYGVLDNRARVTIHFFHRLGALTVTAVLLLLGIVLLNKQAAVWRRLGIAVLAALALQVAIGISIVKLQLPLALADMHNAGAAILLMVMVTVQFLCLETTGMTSSPQPLAVTRMQTYLHEYYELCKPRVVMLIVFTAIIGMFLAVPGLPPLHLLLWGTLGITLQSASAAAVNQIIDHNIDARMARTCGRPLVTGSLSMTQSIAFATVIGLLGFAVLWFLVNPLTAVLTQCALIGYAGIYTLFLKRATPQNIVIGGAAGAAPPVLGWAAITGQVDPHALLLFLIIFIWTPPHFWALAIERHKEYAAVDVPMLPVTHGVEYTRTQVLLYTVLLLITSILPFVFGMSGVIYLAGALILGAVFLYYAVMLKFAPRPGLPMKTFGYSIVYLMGIFTLLLLDHYLH